MSIKHRQVSATRRGDHPEIRNLLAINDTKVWRIAKEILKENPRHLRVFTNYFLDDMSQVEIAAYSGYSKSVISKICVQTIEKIYKRLETKEMHDAEKCL